MPRDSKISNKVQSKKHKKQEELSRKKNNDSDSDNDSNSDTSENSETEEMDMHEYRKFLSKMFPSKDLSKKIKSGEKLKKKIQEQEENYEDECEEEYEEEIEYKKSKSKSKSKKDNENKKQPKKDIKKNKKRKDEEDSEDDEEDERGHFNIILTVGGEEDEDEWEDYDEDYDDDEDTENEDESVSSASSSDEDEDEEEGEDENSDELDDDEEYLPKSKGKYKFNNKYNSKKNKKTDNKKSNKSEKKESTSVEPEKVDKSEKEIETEKETEKIDNTENKKEMTDSLTDNVIFEKLKEIQSQNKDNKILQDCLKVCEENMKSGKKKQEKKMQKQKDKNSRIFKKILNDKNTNNDHNFFCSLLVEEQKTIIKRLREINQICRIEKPYRITLLEADIPPLFKAAAMKKINSLRYMEPGSGEYYKIKNWVDTFMRIKFGYNVPLPITIDNGVDACHDFMECALKTLDSAVYGLNDAKMQIMQMLGQLVTNPDAIGSAIAIQGPMGTGKTTLVKEGISKILKRPFAFIALGGATDSSFLEGHSYTYEGSTWGKIVQIIIDSKCMNPVIYFDELDKISDTPKGEEIAGILTHLTDTSQNNQFHDKYFAEIDFDLSKCLFIFSYNDESKINPILRDRMYSIHTKGYDSKEKLVISNQYLLPKIREQVKFQQEDIIIPDDVISYIIENYCNKEHGVRNMKRCLEVIYTKLNLYRLMKPGSNLFEKEMSLKVEFPFKVTKDVVDKLIKRVSNNEFIKTMYI
jgi:ATP-dependent Lon protease